MNKGVKFRAYPNKEQQNLINKTLGCCRLIYNIGLDMRNKAFKNGEKVNYSKTCAMLTELKRSEVNILLFSMLTSSQRWNKIMAVLSVLMLVLKSFILTAMVMLFQIQSFLKNHQRSFAVNNADYHAKRKTRIIAINNVLE